MDREKVIRSVDSCFDYWLDQHRYLHQLELETVRQFKTEAIGILKKQKAVTDDIKQAIDYLDWYFETDDGTADQDAQKAWRIIKNKLVE